MLTALIAENELLVRMGIRSSVPWPELDIAVVGEAGDGPEAWELFQKYRPDIVLLDIVMPGMDGVELLRKIRAVDRRCAAIVVTHVDTESILDEALGLGVSEILRKGSLKRDDIHEAVRRACQALRRERDGLPAEAAEARSAWEAFLFDRAPGDAPFEAQGLTGLRLFPAERLTPALRRSLNELIHQRLGEPSDYVRASREGCDLLIWRDASAKRDSERALAEIDRYARSYFHVGLGVVTLTAPPQGARLPDMADRLVRLLQEPLLFDFPVLCLDANGGYCDERLDALRGALAISLPVCADRDGIQALKMRLDRYPGELEVGFRRLLGNAAPLLKSLNLSTTQPGLWAMSRRVCDSAEARLKQASPRIRPEIQRAMAYIQAHLTENIQREQLGRLVNYDSVYFSKLFKAELGMSYTEYLLHLRMLRAQELLLETDIPISEIAFRCGYNDFSYFSGRFRQFCGETPHAWRERNGSAMT